MLFTLVTCKSLSQKGQLCSYEKPKEREKKKKKKKKDIRNPARMTCCLPVHCDYDVVNKAQERWSR